MNKLMEMPHKDAAQALIMLILTGARLNEVLKAEWAEIDLENKRWMKPYSKTKQKKFHQIPLSDALVSILQDRKSRIDSPYVFPGRDPSKPMYDIKRAWAWLKQNADLPEGFRTHDLRHTYASLLVSSGHTLHEVSKLLGHTQLSTTMRYAHFMDNPLRTATNHFTALATGGNSKY